jgi:hypothetical protein
LPDFSFAGFDLVEAVVEAVVDAPLLPLFPLPPLLPVPLPFPPPD